VTTGLLTPTHIALVLIVALLILGPKRLPQAGRALGGGIREFKDAITGRSAASPDEQETGIAAATTPGASGSEQS
jgi:sec-independent protein translocase protein TatA